MPTLWLHSSRTTPSATGRRCNQHQHQVRDLLPSSVQQVADAAGYEATGGGFNNMLGKLRTLELIEGKGEV